MATRITELSLYRWRYVIGYGFIGLMVVAMLLVSGLLVPGGISGPEMASVVKSSALSIHGFSASDVINLPYYLFQKLSFMIFGVTPIGVKLPSIILGFVSIVGMLLLLRTWFRRNVAVLATILVITTGQFMYIAQSGTPSIMYVLLPVWLLVAALQVSRRTHLGLIWKILVFVIAALSLYTPLSFYILLALISAAVLHPHLRYIIRRLSKVKLALGALVALVLLVPLGYSIYLDWHIGLTLLGIPNAIPDLAANGWQLVGQYVNFISPHDGLLILPIYGLGSILLIILGVLQLVTTKYTARSYIITAWTILLLPILVINPDFVSVTFVPVIMLMAMGIETLFRSWYQLFPRNPYARVTGLIPLVILIGGMMVSGVDRYMFGYQYSPEVATNFSQDLRLFTREARQLNGDNSTIVATADQSDFYRAVARHYPHMTVTITPPDQPTDTVIVTHDAKARTDYQQAPARIITDRFSEGADRFYVYKSPVN